MAVAPLQLPGYAAPQSLDFTQLGNLGQVYQKSADDAAVKQTLANLGQGDGKIDPRALIASGNLSLAQLGTTLQNQQVASERDTRDFAFRQEESKRAQQNADRSYSLQASANARAGDKTPSGFEKDPATGGLRPMAGGPQDPAYIATATKPRQLSVSDIGKLSDEGQKFGTLTSVANNFKDSYGGYTPGTGDISMAAGRYLPEGLVGKDRAEGAAYWQEYDRYKNVVRNELFGSALTVGETKAFAQADVDPSMQPAQIRKNLARQKEIVEAGLKRKASAMVAAGYSPDQIGKAYGVDLGGLGVSTQRGPAQPGSQQPVRVTSPQQAKSLPSGTPIILPDGSPGVVP